MMGELLFNNYVEGTVNQVWEKIYRILKKNVEWHKKKKNPIYFLLQLEKFLAREEINSIFLLELNIDMLEICRKLHRTSCANKEEKSESELDKFFLYNKLVIPKFNNKKKKKTSLHFVLAVSCILLNN